MKSILSHTVLAACACIVAILCYGFWYTAVGEKSVAVADLESQILTKTETTNRIASARASLAQIAGDEASIQSYFVPETGVVAFIDALQAKGKALGATVDVLSVSATDSSVTATPSLTFSLSIDGTFDAVMRTVGAIEYAPYDLTLSGLSITQVTKGNWHAGMNLRVGSASATQSATSTP